MMPSFVKMYNKISDSENLSMNVHERQHGRLNHDQCIEANIENWKLNGSIVLLVSKSSAKPERGPIDL